MDKTREAYLRFAERRIEALAEKDPECRAVVEEAMALLHQIVEDGQPTPQPAWADGGIEIAWLVGEWYVSLIVVAGEGWLLFADQPDGTELFEAQGQPNVPISLDVLLLIQRVLQTMGEHVKFDIHGL